MATTAKRSVNIIFSGDQQGNNTYRAADNADSPADSQLIDLANGDNTITVPEGATFKSVTIIPPTGNLTLITLKGVGGDTGIPLHKTDPTSLGLDSTESTFILNAGGAGISDVRIIWT